MEERVYIFMVPEEKLVKMEEAQQQAVRAGSWEI